MELSVLLSAVIIWMLVVSKVITSWKLLQSGLCKQKLIITLPPCNIIHIPCYDSTNIWGAVRELPLIMFEIWLYCFHTLEMQRGQWSDSKGACFTNIYYPIKMDMGERSNYLKTRVWNEEWQGEFLQSNMHPSLEHWRFVPTHSLWVYCRVQESVRLNECLRMCEKD